MVFLVVLVMAVVVVALVVRAAANSGPEGSARTPRRQPRPRGPVKFVAPDDDPEFLRELERRARRDDGSPA